MYEFEQALNYFELTDPSWPRRNQITNFHNSLHVAAVLTLKPIEVLFNEFLLFILFLFQFSHNMELTL